jgi:hypothetical protein
LSRESYVRIRPLCLIVCTILISGSPIFRTREPLMVAAEQGWDELVRVLLEGGANALKRDKHTRSAADHAEVAGFTTLAEYLRKSEQQR